ncbi:hypothetical protein BJV74DRAFT_751482, partial [Russula compacta]
EQDLRDALLESAKQDETRKQYLVGTQAGVVLANIYTSQAAEERKKKPKRKHLIGDGKVKLFSGNEFYKTCIEDDKEAAKKRRTHRERHATALAEWKKHCSEIRERNQLKQEQYVDALAERDIEKQRARGEGQQPGWSQPKWKCDFQPETLPERPKKHRKEENERSNGKSEESRSDSK